MRNEKGFTLIELLVVVAIIGILAAIAIPQFAEYRVRAFNATAESDLRNSITAQEAQYVDTQAYIACAADACDGILPGFKQSENVTLAHVLGDSDQEFTATSSHANGDVTWQYNSVDGVIEQQ